MDENDEDLQLSAETLSALQEFYKEQKEKLQREILALDVTSECNEQIEEDWQLSQFWYDDDTINTLAKIAFNAAGTNGKVALISCPSLYKKIKQNQTCEVTLFEYDKRFAAYGSDFIFYDYNMPIPENIPQTLKGTFDVVLADPPFLSEECLTKTADAVKFLAKEKIVLCTGALMEDTAKKVLNLDRCKFEPKHKNNLANDFVCYSNFDVDSLIRLKHKN